MKVKQITLGSSTLALAALLTACGGSSSSGVQKPTPLVANTNNSGNHGTTNHGNHNANNPANPTPSNQAPKWDATVRYGSLRNDAIQGAIEYVKEKTGGITPKITDYTLSVDGKTQDGDLNLSKYPKGHSTLNIKETVTGKDRGQSGSVTFDSNVYLFKQDYSLVAGFHNQKVTTVLPGKDGKEETKPVNEIDFLAKGVPTEKLPTTGKFNYSGSGRVRTQSGIRDDKFSYNVDFGAKTGSGSLGNITLSKGNITTQTLKNKIDNSFITTPTIEGKATDGRYSGDYDLGFFGPNADEVVGVVELGDEDVIGIFGGTKQAK